MDKEEIKDYLKRVDELGAKLTEEDKETYNWLIYGYNQCAKLLNETEQQCKKQKEVEEKITKEIEELNKEYLYEKNETIYCKDEEAYHGEFDDIIIKFLKKSNYRKIAKLYEKAKEFFWYA